MGYVPIDQLPASWRREIRETRAENSRLRIRAREAERELSELKVSLGLVSADV